MAISDFPQQLQAEVLRRALYLQRFRIGPDGEPRDEAEVERLHILEWHRCAGDIHHWLSTYCWLEDPKELDPDKRVLPLILWEGQVRLVDFLVSGLDLQEDRNVNKAREIGVSWLSCMVVLHRWLFEQGFKAKLGSRKQDYVDNRTSDSLFGKIRFAIDRQPDFLLPWAFQKGNDRPRRDLDSNLRLMNPEMGSEIIGESSNPNFGRGGRRALILIDEDAFVETRIQDSMHLALATVASSKWRVSTPNGRGNRFHADYEVARKLETDGATDSWAKWLELDWTTDPRRDQAWFDGLLKENGGTLTWDEREQEHRCSFSGVTGLRIFKPSRNVTYTDSDLHFTARPAWYWVAAMDFGSGPSWTCCYWMLVNWDEGDGEVPLILVDSELVRARTSAYEIGADILSTSAMYGGYGTYCGDPTGDNAESDQESWISRLNRAGVPISALPREYNTPDFTTHALREAQMMMDRGMLKIHKERCPQLLDTVESWQWDLPPGVPLELVNRDTLKPRKDMWSHSGDAAFRYGMSLAIRTDRSITAASVEAFKEREKAKPAVENEVTQPSHQLDELYAATLRGIGW